MDQGGGISDLGDSNTDRRCLARQAEKKAAKFCKARRAEIKRTAI